MNPTKVLNKLCPRCGRGLVRRMNRQNGSEFLGCEGWAPGDAAHCGHTEPLPEWYRLVASGATTLPGFGS